MDSGFEIVDINTGNVDKRGFFCYMSKRKSPGYRQKRDWLEARFSEGMKIKIIHEVGGRDVGFIEYLPGEYAWRVVRAPGYLVIHCLWVVGKGKGKGYGSRLLQVCLEDARAQNKHGVVMVTSDSTWLAGKKLFLKNGFEEVDQASPSYQLMVYRFGSAPLPAFPTDWQARQARFGSGITVIRTAQCPYIENSAKGILQTAQNMGIPARVVQLDTPREVQESAPTPYGVFAILYDGRFISHHYLNRKELEKHLGKVD
jgi:L-amino acid N-acyltransferase YncA